MASVSTFRNGTAGGSGNSGGAAYGFEADAIQHPGLVCAEHDRKRACYEHDLDRRALQKRWDWPAADSHFFVGSADVSRKEAKQ